MKKSLVLLFTIFLCVMNGACLTSKLYGSKKPPLDETITGFLVTADQKQLIFVGQHYHYIFPLPNDLKNILAWSSRGKLEASNLHFIISRGNVINGSYSLGLIDQATVSDEDRNFLLANGFREHTTAYNRKLNQTPSVRPPLPSWVDPRFLTSQETNAHDVTFTFQGQLNQGHVYDPGHFQLPEMIAFKSPYHLIITYDYASAGQTAGAILLTPLSVAADGVITVAGVVIGIPVFLLAEGAHH